MSNFNHCTKNEVFHSGGSRISFRVLQNLLKKNENRNDIIMQKNYRFSKKQEDMVCRGADLKVKFDSSKKNPTYGG